MSTAACDLGEARQESWLDWLNGRGHKASLWTYTVIVLAHWAEHLLTCADLPIRVAELPESKGVLGLWYPALVSSEALHYGYAFVMLAAFWILRKGFVGRSYTWWMIAFWIQFWHHIEHALLQGQAIFGANLFGSPVPMSIAQLVVPRVELHLFYNAAVTIPMVVAMFYHMFPLPGEEAHMGCSCAWHARPKTA